MKNFGMQHKVFLSILPFFVVFALIGSGFALFIFDNQETSNNANISITVENGYELGNIYLTSSTVTSTTLSDNVPSNQEKDDTSLSTTLFFDYKQLYFIRSDNITKERDFNIYYYNSSSESDDFSYSNVQLNLDISITSSIAKDNIQTDSTSGYKYSTSAIDYIDLDTSKAGVVTTDSNGDTSDNKATPSSKTTYSNDNKTASATYTLQTGLASNTNYVVNLDLLYNSTLAPSADTNSSYFSDVISKMKAAITDSETSIALKFYLTYNE